MRCLKGAGLLYWLKLLNIYDTGSARRAVGFDTFDSFGPSSNTSETAAVNDYVSEANFKGTSPEEIMTMVKAAGIPDHRCELIKGDITETAQSYVEKHPGFRIALLHMDLDLAAPTLAALKAMWPRIVRGGIVVLDEYAIPRWTESDAVDQFLADHKLEIKTIPYARTPTAYIRKA
ncbi:MAG: class I SAM-dependent methyltransferase [Myxococcales bacterium]|nr:MAG: class I SAM-dependent methyltransferase [Myxococcales bacterium]